MDTVSVFPLSLYGLFRNFKRYAQDEFLTVIVILPETNE